MPPDPRELNLSQWLEDATWVRSLAARLVADPHLADDLSQEVLLAEWCHPRGDGPGRRPWLRAILRNLVRLQRRRGTRREHRERDAARPEVGPATADVVAQTELQQRVVAEVLALPEPYRGTLLRRYMRERSAEDIARDEGLATATVRSRIHRGLAMLRERMHSVLGPSWRSALVALGVPTGRSPVPLSGSSPVLLGATMKLAVTAVIAIATVGLVALVWSRAPEPALPVATSGPLETNPDPLRLPAEDASPVREEVAAEQPGAPAAAPHYIGPGTALSGIVVTRSDQPIAGAQVTLLGVPTAELEDGPELDPIGTTTTDARGAFAIADLPPTVANTLHVTAVGFTPAFEEVHPGLVATVRLSPAGRLFGTVTDAMRRPIAGVHVRTPVLMVANGRLSTMAESISDEQGNYELAGLPVGDGLALEVLRPGSAPFATRAQLTGAATRYDVRLADLATLDGSVVSAETRMPVAGAQVSSGGLRPRTLALTDLQGRFSLRLHDLPTAGARAWVLRGLRPQLGARHETVTIHAPGFCQTVQPLAPLVARRNAVAEIQLVPAGSIVGHVVDRERQPVARALVYWEVPGEVLLEPGAWVEPGPTSQRVRTAADGSFSMPEVLPGIEGASVAVRRPRYPPHRALDVGPARAGETRAVLIELDTGVIVSGRIQVNGVPERAYVYLKGDAGPSDGVTLRTEADGHYAFHGVLPGAYEIKACTADGTAVWSDPVSLRVGDRSPPPIALAIGAPFAALTGTLIECGGVPQKDVTVAVFPGDATTGILSGMAQTDAQGHFEVHLGPDGPGTYTLAVTWHGFRVFARAVTPGGAPTELVLPAVTAVTMELRAAATLEPLRAARLAFRRSEGEPWTDLLSGRETPLAADGGLQVELPLGALELRIDASTDGVANAIRKVFVTDGGRVELRL